MFLCKFILSYRTTLLMLMIVMLCMAVSQLYRLDCKTGKSLSEIYQALRTFDLGKRLLLFVVQAIRNDPSAAHQSKSDTRSKTRSKSDADLIEDSDREKVVYWLSAVDYNVNYR
jgi:hypothetical protein